MLTIEEGDSRYQVQLLTNTQAYIKQLLLRHEQEFSARRAFLQRNLTGAALTDSYDNLMEEQTKEFASLKTKLESVSNDLTSARRNSHKPDSTLVMLSPRGLP